jgi:hypothetical protein
MRYLLVFLPLVFGEEGTKGGNKGENICIRLWARKHAEKAFAASDIGNKGINDDRVAAPNLHLS